LPARGKSPEGENGKANERERMEGEVTGDGYSVLIQREEGQPPFEEETP